MKRTKQREFFRFVIPSILSMVVFNLYTLVDGMFVAQFVGEDALAAINVATPYITAIFAIGVLFAIGASTVMSMYRGEGNETATHRVFTMNIITVSMVALVISIGSVLSAEALAALLGANVDVYAYVTQYIRIIASFAYFYIVSYCLEVLLKTDGYPHISMIGVLIGACTNIGLDYVFMRFFHWGLAGAAFATGLSQVVTFFLFLAHFALSGRSHFHFVKGPYPWREYRRIVPLGLADCLSEISPGIMIVAFNYRINQLLSTSGLVSFSVIMYVYNLVIMAMVGISQGVQPLISYYYGKQDMASIRMLHRYARFLALGLSLVFFLASECLTGSLVSCYLDQGEAAFMQTREALRQFAWVFLWLGQVVITSGYLTAIEQPKSSLVLSLLRGIVMSVTVLYLATALYGAKGIWVSAAISEALCLVVALVLLKRHPLPQESSSKS